MATFFTCILNFFFLEENTQAVLQRSWCKHVPETMYIFNEQKSFFIHSMDETFEYYYALHFGMAVLKRSWCKNVPETMYISKVLETTQAILMRFGTLFMNS